MARTRVGFCCCCPWVSEKGHGGREGTTDPIREGAQAVPRAEEMTLVCCWGGSWLAMAALARWRHWSAPCGSTAVPQPVGGRGEIRHHRPKRQPEVP